MGKSAPNLLDRLGSLKLSFWLFVLLLWLTFWGTWAQAKMSLYDVQKEYFESTFVLYWVGDKVPIPMLGGYLLLSILFGNLFIGGIVNLVIRPLLRGRFRPKIIGVIIAHLGVLVLLVGSFVEFHRKTEGSVRLYPGESSQEYVSHDEWEVAVGGPGPDGRSREYVIPSEHFTDLAEGESTRYSHADLPFDVVLSDFARNALIRPTVPGQHMRRTAEGLALVALEPVGAGPYVNRPAVMATIVPERGQSRRAILLGNDKIFDVPPPSIHSPARPYAFAMDGKLYSVDLRTMRWKLPFAIQLNKFVHKRHAGTSMAKEFSSYITKFESGPEDGSLVEQDHHITMNAPLRHKGYTFYQSSWGPQADNLPPDTPLYSQFAVVSNPTDQWPLISCIIIAFGLLVHFIMKLVYYLKAEAKRLARAQGAA